MYSTLRYTDPNGREIFFSNFGFYKNREDNEEEKQPNEDQHSKVNLARASVPMSHGGTSDNNFTCRNEETSGNNFISYSHNGNLTMSPRNSDTSCFNNSNLKISNKEQTLPLRGYEKRDPRRRMKQTSGNSTIQITKEEDMDPREYAIIYEKYKELPSYKILLSQRSIEDNAYEKMDSEPRNQKNNGDIEVENQQNKSSDGELKNTVNYKNSTTDENNNLKKAEAVENLTEDNGGSVQYIRASLVRICACNFRVCPGCWAEFKEFEKISLPCGHVYCKRCIEDLARAFGPCYFCRVPFTRADSPVVD